MKGLLILLALATPALAQFGNATRLQGVPICAPLTLTDGFVVTYDTTSACFKTEAAAGGSVAFSDITNGTNTSAAMVVGNGASLSATGTGTIAATSVTGLSVTASKTLTVSNTLTLTGTDSSSVAFGAGGTVTYTIASGAKALDTDEIASEACDTMTATATGAASTDTIQFTANADITGVTGYAPVTEGGLSIYVWPTTNTVNIKVCNPTASPITPGAVTLNWRVTR